MIDQVRDEYRRGRRAPLLVSPTGSGKTVMFCYVAKHSALRGRRVWILVHRQELVAQTSRALHSQEVPHGIVAASRQLAPNAMVQVASVDTLVRRLDRLPPPDLIVIDEAHHAVAGTWSKILNHCSSAMILGVTATPERLDGRGLGRESGGWFDAMVLGPTTAQLIGMGFLARPRLFASRKKIDLERVKRTAGDFNARETTQVMSAPDIVGDAVGHYRRICPDVPAIAFCCSIEHAQTVSSAFNAAGIASESIDGKVDDTNRRRKLEELSSGRIKVLTSCALISEGFDAPAVGAALLLRPTMSLGMYLQQVGRALRPAPGKDAAFILDHAGCAMKHGLPTDDREWSLDAKRRKPSDRLAPIRTCTNCFAIAPAYMRECPECGAPFPVSAREVREGDDELVEVNKELEKYVARRKRIAEESQCETLEDWIALGRRRQYDHPVQWARKRHELRMSRGGSQSRVVNLDA